MFFDSTLLKEVSTYFSVRKIGKTSNASKNITKLTFRYPLQFKYNSLLLRKKWFSGRNNSGRITVFSKGSISKKRLPFINYNYRNNCIFFIAGLNYTSYNLKLSSLIFNSTGEVCYIPSRSSDRLFLLARNKSFFKKTSPSILKDVLTLNPYLLLDQIPFMLIQQKKNSSISFVESWPLKKIQYTRSFGSQAKIIKLDTRTGLSLVKLSSGIKKIFSAFSLASKGRSNLYILKNRFKNTKSGYWRGKGLKSIVRGVAMNPVDHPHGGRTNSIKYPRTPWGKTTKYK